jgi:hypothetical protein
MKSTTTSLRWVWVLTPILFLQSLGVQSHAQDGGGDPPTKNTEAGKSVALDDIVVLNSGRKVRGTILDSDPNGDVTILNSENKKLIFSMKEVQFAGTYSKWKASEGGPTKKPDEPKTSDPQKKTDNQTTTAATKKASDEVEVQFEGQGIKQERDWTFYKFIGTVGGLTVTATTYSNGVPSNSISPITLSNYSMICVAPCSQSWKPGTYRLAMSKGKDAAIEGDFVNISGPSKVTGNYISHAKKRTTGWFIFGVSSAVWAIGLIGSFSIFQTEHCTDSIFPGGKQDCSLGTNYPVLIGTGIVGIVGMIVGLNMVIFTNDEVKFEVTPLKLSSWQNSDKQALYPRSSGSLTSLAPQGLMLRATF